MTRVPPPEPMAAAEREVPRWLYLWLPLALVVAAHGMRAVSEPAYERWMRTELGVIEVLTAILLVGAVAAGVVVVRRARGQARGLRLWFALLAMGCFYFLGEEVSWGQHFFGWGTPEAFARINEQGETNLHNIGGWTEGLLDQGPRALLSLGAFVGGVLGPTVLAGVRRRQAAAGDARAWLWPTAAALPAALLANVANLPRKVAAFFDGEVPAFLDVRGGELKECFLALFLLIYLASAALRMSAERSREPQGRVSA